MEFTRARATNTLLQTFIDTSSNLAGTKRVCGVIRQPAERGTWHVGIELRLHVSHRNALHVYGCENMCTRR